MPEIRVSRIAGGGAILCLLSFFLRSGPIGLWGFF